MSIQVETAIIHAIVSQGEGQLVCRMRPQPLNDSQALTTTLEELHRIYTAKPGKGYGYFGIPEGESDPEVEANTAFKEALREYRQGNLGFVDFSRQAGELLQSELSKYDFATGGFLLLSSYNHTANDYLFVALLSAKPSLTVSDDMELHQNDHLDLSNLQLAARINLTEWDADADSRKYISFVKGRAGRKVADFFLDFMGCAEGINVKAQNKSLMVAVEDCVAESELDKQERQQVRDNLFSYASEQVDKGESLKLPELSEQLAEAGLDDFYAFTNNGDYALEDEFDGDKSTLRQLKKFSGSGAGVSVSFDAIHLGERVIYNPHQDTLMIKGIPPNLKDQLERRLKGSD
ncbi:nucleoid-associated protein YejK [Paraferrimonas sedimenticola]|uniref:Nucleoid-associated protein GCM10007895_32950 n=1 Tax=Paraferrimonas sedimenticola TaxID=375674 RepID=A0AA37RZE1_9GAMM|nr:nucleoid-associated protein YejK [Paraferrimonas sedimenticola]GLP97988.1 nucleoid-associated protein [Paraferrimonas sedimenticola]